MFGKNHNLELWKSILIWFIENDSDQFEISRNQLSSPKLKGLKLWFCFGTIKLMENNTTKPGDMKTITGFDSKTGYILINKSETIKL